MKKWISATLFFIILAITMLLCLIGLAVNDANKTTNERIPAAVICSILFIVFIIISIFIPFAVKKLRKMSVELPVLLPNDSKNYIKNPVRKKVYIGLVIYGLVCFAILISLCVVAVKTNDDKFLKIIFVPFVFISVFILPFVLKFVKNKEIDFFVEYFDFKPTSDYIPSDAVFDSYEFCVFSPNGLITKKTTAYPDAFADREKEITIPYSDLELSAKPAYKTMGDMMTNFIIVSLAEHAKTEAFFHSYYPDSQSDDIKYANEEGDDLFPEFVFRLDQQLFDDIKDGCWNLSDDIASDWDSSLSVEVTRVSHFTCIQAEWGRNPRHSGIDNLRSTGYCLYLLRKIYSDVS